MLLATGAYLIVITYHALPLTMFQFIRISNNPISTQLHIFSTLSDSPTLGIIQVQAVLHLRGF